MSRVLATTERHVDAPARDVYFAELQHRRVVAEAAHVHFWVFEHATQHGRFIEFVEAPDAVALARAFPTLMPTDVWRAVQGES